MTTEQPTAPPRPPAPWRRPRHRRRRERPRRLLQRRPAADPHRLRRPDGVQRARPGTLSARLVVHPDRYRRPIGRPAHPRRLAPGARLAAIGLILLGAVFALQPVSAVRAAPGLRRDRGHRAGHHRHRRRDLPKAGGECRRRDRGRGRRSRRPRPPPRRRRSRSSSGDLLGRHPRWAGTSSARCSSASVCWH